MIINQHLLVYKDNRILTDPEESRGTWRDNFNCFCMDILRQLKKKTPGKQNAEYCFTKEQCYQVCLLNKEKKYDLKITYAYDDKNECYLIWRE